MSSDDSSEIATEGANNLQESGSISNFVEEFGVGGVGWALILALIGTISAAGDLVLAPFRALAGGLEELVGGTIGGGVGVIDAAADAAAQSFTSGSGELLGPFAFPAAVLVVMLGVLIFMRFVSNIGFSPLSFISRFR